MLGVLGAFLRGFMTYAVDFRTALDDIDHSVLSQWRDGSSFSGLTRCIPTDISAFKRGMLLDRDLYKELTKYQCKTMEDFLSRAWPQVKWEDVASRAKTQKKQDPKTIRPDQTEQDEKSSQIPARDSGNQNRAGT